MKRIAILVLWMALLLPSAALAQSSSTCQAYNPQTASCEPVHTTAATDGTLPFTGLDVALLAVGGGGLFAAGLVVRRLSRRVS